MMGDRTPNLVKFMKAKYIGTKIEDREYLSFGITAAKMGTNKSALLKKLVIDFVAATEAATKQKQKEVA